MMVREDLQWKLDECQKYFKSVKGEAFAHFFCPILHVDEEAELCRAHITNGALNDGNIWVPQRQDVDGFYGTSVEADMIEILRHRNAAMLNFWTDPKIGKKLRPKLACDGDEWKYYFPKTGAPSVPGHSVVQVMDGEEVLCNVAIKVSPEEMIAAKDRNLEIVFEADFRPCLTAAMLKAAHLTMFRMLGYSYVFSPTGDFVAHILRTFFQNFNGKAKPTEEEVAKHFFRFPNMVHPFVCQNPDLFSGTAKDEKVFCCFSSKNKDFAIGVIISAGDAMFCVFLPTSNDINLYFSFLNEPPKSISVRGAQYRRQSDEKPAHWEMWGGDRWTFPLNQPMPDGA